MKLFLLLFLSVALNANATVIYAEESPNYFIKVDKQDKEYSFYECTGTVSMYHCQPLLKQFSFTTSELNSLSNKNYWNAVGTTALDVVSLFGGAIVGAVKGVKYSSKVLKAKGYSLDGCANCGGIIWAVPAGGSVGVVEMIFDDMDPFIDRDIAIAYEAIIDTASYSDLKDVESREINGELIVTVEDLDFSQLRSVFIDQLEGKKD